MESMVVFLILYSILIVFDLIPMIRKKDKKALFVAVPVYILTLTADIMLSFGANLPSPSKFIGNIVTSIIH